MTAKKEVQAASDAFQAPAVQQHDSFVAMVERLAGNPNVDADKLEKIIDQQLRVWEVTAKREFYDCFAGVQATLPRVINDAHNPQTRSQYAKLEAIARAIKPIYTKAGFSTSFTEAPSNREGYIRMEGTLMHSGGHAREGYCAELPIDSKGIAGKANKTEVHGTGSTFKYLRRYLTCMMFDVETGDEDNDGNRDKYVEAITEAQAADLQALIEGAGGDDDWQNETAAGIKKWAQIDRLADLPADKYDACCRSVQKRIKATL